MGHTPAPTTDHAADILIDGLTKTYGDGLTAVTALGTLDLTAAAGEFVAVVGASGCGKSTLLRILAGFEKPTSGTVKVAGEPITGPGPDRAVVFQDYGLFPWLSVQENIAVGPRHTGKISKRAAMEHAGQYMKAVGLARFARSFPNQLSGGMQQRVAIARVLANDPSLMLMDEPFGALDALTRSEMQAELSRLHQETGTTVVFVTHSIEEAVFLSNRVVVMAGGPTHGNAGHIREIVPIDLSGDRDINSREFNDYERRISALIHQGNHVLATG